jgi:phenylpropionate dioxygenase-like ring-hydroxylating dioxygenase large terminal subunit
LIILATNEFDGGSKMAGQKRTLAYSGYHEREEGTSNLFLTQTGAGTPAGEYLRRFWLPIAMLSELGDLPRRERVLGEDLVVFRDKRGEVGVLHLSCCHRGTSLEFGRIEQCGIRCCYHGRLFDVDGTILEVPGDPNEKAIQNSMVQGAYPTHVFAGLVFTYMGPPEKKPPFPKFDHFDLPGVRLALPIRMPFACNWVQTRENALDPAHTAVLHAWEDRFADQFGVFPEFEFSEAPGGAFYLAVRRVGDNIWIRSTSVMMPTIAVISDVRENKKLRQASPPFMSLFTVPTDDTNTVTFGIPHVRDDESLERRMAFGWVGDGQSAERPYKERQRIPGDYDAQVGQGAIEKHSKEHLSYHDRGVAMFRRLLKRGIEAVQRGEDPAELAPEIVDRPLPSFATDRVVPISVIEGNPDDPEVLRGIGRKLAQEYLQCPPMSLLK